MQNRGKIVKKVIEGGSLLANPSYSQGTSWFWMDLFSRPSLPENHHPITLKAIPVVDIFGPVTEEEMVAAVASTTKYTAPGPVGRTAADLRALESSRPAWVATSCL